MIKRHKTELTVYFDVDQTLVFDNITTYPHLPRVKLSYYGIPKVCSVHIEHVKLLKAYKKRGYEITIWSANGEAWAYEVATKLGLEDFIYETKCKPNKLVDDKEANEGLGRVIYVPVEESGN